MRRRERSIERPICIRSAMVHLEERKGIGGQFFLSSGAQRTIETADAARLETPFLSLLGETP